MEAMERLMEGRTTFIIAHRLGTLASCDLRLELDQGRLTVASGARAGSNGATGPNPRVAVARRGFADDGGHPALRAWEELVGGAGGLNAVETLKRSKQVQAYRLHGAGSELRVVAKRERTDKLEFERTVYEQVLPKLRVPSAAYYGFLDEADTPFAWLFVEDLGDAWLRPEDERQLTEAARFLGALHTSVPGATEALPDRGPAYYGECLREGRDRLRSVLPTVPLPWEDQSLLRSVIAECDRVDSAWDRVEQACAGLPAVPVHGDFQGKNVRVKQVDGRLETVAFDWESAGFGLPAADAAILGRNESDAAFRHYLRELQDAWPELTLADVIRLVDVGLLFRTLQAVSWASYISPDWVEQPLDRLAAYERRLRPALERTLRHA